MKKILTALGSPSINFELMKKFNVVEKDIQYQEGIFEYLEKDKNVDYIILNEDLPGNLKIERLVFLIKNINPKIKIILITQGNTNIQVYRKISNINANIITDIIQDDDVFAKRTIPINDFFNQQNDKNKKSKITTIVGANGVGKSVFSIVLAKTIKDRKVLVLDFDFYHENLYFILNKRQNLKSIQEEIKQSNIQNRKINIEKYVTKVNSNVDLLSGMSVMFNPNEKIKFSKIKEFLDEFTYVYDEIIIDTSSNNILDYTKDLIKMSDETLFISGANLLEIRKAKRLLEKYNNVWNLPKSCINIIFNKCTINSIDDEVLKNMFRGYNILGKIALNEYYDLFVNGKQSSENKISNDIRRLKVGFGGTRNAY